VIDETMMFVEEPFELFRQYPDIRSLHGCRHCAPSTKRLEGGYY
jgi:hypothetical protein